MTPEMYSYDLVDLDRWATVGKIAGAITHDLNNPLTSILIFAEALTKNSEGDSVFYEQANELLESAKRCRELTHRFLKFIRRPTSQPKEVSLSHVVTDIQALIQHQMAIEKKKLKISIPDKLSSVLACHKELEQVLLNLLLLALETIEPGMEIHLEANEINPSHNKKTLNILIRLPNDYIKSNSNITGPESTNNRELVLERIRYYNYLLSKMDGKLEYCPNHDSTLLAIIHLQQFNYQ